MKRTKKLKKNYEFNYVFKKGKFIRGKYLECFYITKNKENYNSLGIAISSKICKAVKRNEIKRKIIAVYTEIEEKIKKGNIFVFLWRKDKKIEDCSFTNILEDMLNILKNTGLLNEEYFD